VPDPEPSTAAAPRAETLPGVLRAAAGTWPRRPALVQGEETLTFAALLEAVRRTARGYLALGLQPGERVVVWAPNSNQWVVHALAVSYAGGVLVPANSRYTGREVADLVARAAARLAVVEDGFLGRHQVAELAAAGVGDCHVVRLGDELDPRGVSDEEAEARADAVGADDVADILFTSGTTGRSKGAVSAHRQTVGVARAWGGLGGLTVEDRYLVVNPFFHSFGYKAGIVVGLTTGAAVHPLATFDLEETMRLIEEARITVLPGAPTIYQSLLDAPGRLHRDLSSLRLAVTGAAVVPVALIEKMRDELAIDTVVTAFGMTEAVVVTMCREDDDAETVATTCGRPIPGMEIATGDQDELLVRGEFVMLGYLDDQEATAEAIDEEGWLHTGDVGRIDEHGNLTITDRLKDMYISGGFNVYPAEVEQALAHHPAIVEAAVVGVPDQRLGEVGKAFVVRRDETLTRDDVVGFARERMANFKVPREVEFIDVLPRNLSGKVLKTDLRAEPAGEPDGS
jgi:HIP---CoA ligase